MERDLKTGLIPTIVAVAGVLLITAFGVIYLFLGFSSSGISVPSKIFNRDSDAGVTCSYDLSKRTLTITSYGEDYVWPLAPFMLSSQTNRQNLLLSAEHFDCNPAVAFAFSEPVQENKIDTVRIDTHDYLEIYTFQRNSQGRVVSCRVTDTGSGIPDFTLYFTYDAKGRFSSIEGNYMPQRDVTEKQYYFGVAYAADGTIESIDIINQSVRNEITFQKDTLGRFTHLEDFLAEGADIQEGTLITDYKYDEHGRLSSEKSADDWGSTVYQYKKDGTLHAIRYEDHTITIHHIKLYD